MTPARLTAIWRELHKARVGMVGSVEPDPDSVVYELWSKLKIVELSLESAARELARFEDEGGAQ